MQIICQTSIYIIISIFFLIKLTTRHDSVLQPVSYVHLTEPETVLPGCQGDSFSGCANSPVPQTVMGGTWKSPPRPPLPTTPTLHIATTPRETFHSSRPPPYPSPLPCSPHPVTYRGGRKDLASLSWTLGLVPNAEVATGIGCWPWD